jgi:hypothetical protein
MRFLVALTLAQLVSNVAFAGVVVWMDDGVPENRVRLKADGKTGGTKHAAGPDLVFPPAPAGVNDDAEYEALRKAVADGKTRWNDFEVEYDIAVALEAAISAIDVIRSERDRDELVQALLFQGALPRSGTCVRAGPATGPGAKRVGSSRCACRSRPTWPTDPVCPT